MNMSRISAAILALSCTVSVSAGSETYQYCTDMYPADSYDAEERNLYIQECLQAYGDTDNSEPVVQGTEEAPYIEETPYTEEAPYEEAPYYDGTVEEFVGEQPEPQEEYYSE